MKIQENSGENSSRVLLESDFCDVYMGAFVIMQSYADDVYTYLCILHEYSSISFNSYTHTHILVRACFSNV